MTRVVLVDDQAVVRAGFTVILESEGFEVVGEAANGADAVRVARRERPDVVCMDVRMPGGDGITATRALAGPGVVDPVPVLVVSTFDLDDYVFGALEAGASGFLLKDAEPDVLVDAVRRVASGEGLVDQTLTRRVIDEFARRRSPAAPDEVASGLLTSREHDILALLCRGSSNAEIAAALFLEASTVKSHLSRIMTKTGMRDRVQLVVWAYERGIAAPAR
ncbi:response regulator transcription factor [Oerskovia turbata]|uniref:Response regulator transcription factor n=1 Tax=Oerskovia turbata TaxID=1713 RepID=A0A4Q1KUU4_9CELL|nr:response regulator transcription factor [Oerskovia turbata]RXR25713.1 response regulator transcription factor [Oerskovia turbata]RXR33199.1 response regulator transcription factor [Oerskovia turbata]TGJ96270.1 DNA-binding response regulator [Actinotalea fermentans ATCC 43279 = JCM 9966 = DSM 3133]